MRIPKRYGQSKVHTCPFCVQQATTMNPQKIPVCPKHKEQRLTTLKCACGSYLDFKEGPYGTFCLCFNCGPINLNKALNFNR